jgi:small subunit ribosomal protein S1
MSDRPKGFSELFAEYERGGRGQTKRQPRVGEEVTSRVVAISDDAVFVDLGGKAEGLIERAELTDREGVLGVAVGDTVSARVVQIRDGQIVLRTKLGRGDDPFEDLARAHELRMPVVGKVCGVNKGGVEVEIGGVQAFCPLSQLELGYVEDPGTFLGRELEFLVVQHERGRGDRPNVVLSRRALLEDARAVRAAELRARLEVGAVVQGTVTRLTDFGAFVDLGGLDGLLHKSELGFGRIGHPSEVLSVGDVVEAQITKIEPTSDPKRPDKIGLSLKSLKGDPWAEMAETLRQGAQLRGTVMRLEPFGAFVSLSEGVEGMVHVSELSERRVSHPREVVSVGQEVEVVVLEVDGERRRVALSMKQVALQREAADAASYQPSGAALGTFGELLKKKLGK